MLLSLIAVLLAIVSAPLLDRVELACSDAVLACRYYVNSRLLRRVRPFYRPTSVRAVQPGEQSGPAAPVSGSDSSLISEGICLVGIDAPTLEWTGKYGSGDWVVRRPFLLMAKLFRDVFRPKVAAFDILFQSVSEAGQEGTGAAYAPESLDAMIATLERSRAGQLGAEPFDVLLAMSRFASQLSEEKLAASFAALSSPHGVGAPAPVPVVSAFLLLGLEVGGHGRWTRSDVVGAVPAEASLDNGNAIPYLLDLAIPWPNIHDLPYGHRFAPNGKLPTLTIRDYVTLGFINVPRDPDGIIRRVPVVAGFSFQDPISGRTRREVLPSFALLNALAYWGVGLDAVQVYFGDRVEVHKSDGDVVRIPIDTDGRMFLDFTGRVRDFCSISLRSFLHAGMAELTGGAPSASPAHKRKLADMRRLIDGKIVMVGLTADGTTDIGPTPIDPNTPFVHVHMSAVNSMLTGRFLKPAGRTTGLVYLGVIFLLYTLLCCTGSVSRLSWGAVAFLIGILAVFYLAVHLHIVLLPVVMPVTYVVAAYCSVMFFRYFTQERARKRIRSMFSTMVSGDVLTFMEENPEIFSLSGVKAEATVMFSDVAEFTSISEKVSATELSELLNRYFSEMTEIIMADGGYVDKFEGDAIMAEWGVPYPRDDHALAACLAVLRQKDRIAELRPVLQADFGVNVRVRFGLSSGLVSAGNMGSSRRFQYTVMGNVVNAAARLEPANKDYGTDIIICEQTYGRAREGVEARLLDKIVVAGKSEPIVIYELLAQKGSIGPERRLSYVLYEKALRSHWERNWAAAQKALTEALTLNPDDEPAQRLLLRVADFSQNAPPPEWQGEYVRTRKD